MRQTTIYFLFIFVQYPVLSDFLIKIITKSRWQNKRKFNFHNHPKSHQIEIWPQILRKTRFTLWICWQMARSWNMSTIKLVKLLQNNWGIQLFESRRPMSYALEKAWPVLNDHLSYATIFVISLGRSYKTGLTVLRLKESWSWWFY